METDTENILPEVEQIVPLNGLVAQILEVNARNLSNTTNSLIDNLQTQLKEAQATLALAYNEVYRLANGPVMVKSTEIRRSVSRYSSATRQLYFKQSWRGSV